MSSDEKVTAIRMFLAGQPITRAAVRRACNALRFGGADDLYKEVVKFPSERSRSGENPSTQHSSFSGPSPVSEAYNAITWHSGKTSGHRGTCPPAQVPVVEIDVLDWNPVAVFSDLHIPAHDAAFMERCVDKALAEGCEKFIIAGDLTDNNQWHKRTHGIRTERKWQDDIDLSRSVLAWLCANFTEGYFFFGNHDEWVVKMLAGQADSNWLYKHLYPNLPLRHSYKHQVRLVQETKPEVLVVREAYDAAISRRCPEWRIIHGEHFSQNPVATMEKYCAKWQSNVLSGHMHWAAQGEYGPWNWVLNGGSFDERRQDFLHERPSNMKKTQQGFTIISSGRATLYRGSDPRW